MLPRLARALAGAVLVAGLAACGDGAEESAGAAVFDNHCVQCHGAGGRGSLGPELMTVLARYGWTGADDGTLEPALAAVRTVVLEGLRASGRAPMPAFEGRRTQTELDALMDHLVTIQTAAG
jgi:mono/diheme cytochrome c family protein